MDTATVSLGSVPLLSGKFQITGLVGLTIGAAVPVFVAVNENDPTGSEEQISISGIALSSSIIDCYWQSVDGTPKSGSLLVSYLVADTVSVIGPFIEFTESGTGTLTNYSVAQNVNSIVFNGTGEIIFEGIDRGLLEPFDGRRLFLRCSTDILIRIKHESTGSANSSRFRTPNEKDFILRPRDVVELYYTASRWVVISRARDWQRTLSVTWAAQQDNLAIGDADRIRVILTGDQTLTGIVPFVANTDNDGQTVLIENRDDVDCLTIEHLSAASTSTNQIACPGSVAFKLGGRCSVMLRYDGTTFVWRLAAQSSQEGESGLFGEIIWDDQDFNDTDAMSGGATPGTFFALFGFGGSTGAPYWIFTTSVANASWVVFNNELRHHGIIQIATVATTNTFATLFHVRDTSGSTFSVSEPVLNMSEVTRAEFFLRVPSNSNIEVYAGFFDNPQVGDNGVYIQLNTGVDNNWHAVTRLAATSTDTSSGVAVVSGNWFKLSMRRKDAGSGWYFYVNNVLFTPTGHTTNIFSGGVLPAISVKARDANIKLLDVDRVRIWIDEDVLWT
jgi:hypothetical protein